MITDDNTSEVFHATMQLRWKWVYTPDFTPPEDGSIMLWETAGTKKLQQMHQGSNGTENWVDIPTDFQVTD